MIYVTFRKKRVKAPFSTMVAANRRLGWSLLRRKAVKKFYYGKGVCSCMKRAVVLDFTARPDPSRNLKKHNAAINDRGVLFTSGGRWFSGTIDAGD